jgi:hypothetical protein
MEDHAEPQRVEHVLGFRVAHRPFLVISSSLFLLLLIHVALNPVSSHAYSSPLNVVHTLIINSLLHTCLKLSFSVSLSPLSEYFPPNLGGGVTLQMASSLSFRRKRK